MIVNSNSTKNPVIRLIADIIWMFSKDILVELNNCPITNATADSERMA
jgi:hypothetical protein